MILNNSFSEYDKSEGHRKQKVHVAQILNNYLERIKKSDWTVSIYYDYGMPVIEAHHLGPRQFFPDILVIVSLDKKMLFNRYMDIEIDGDAHLRAGRKRKDDLRDSLMAEHFTMPTVRLPISWLGESNGRKGPKFIPLSEDEVIKAIDPVKMLSLPYE